MKNSAGLLLFRRTGTEIEFFLVHPGGPFFARKQEGWWAIPKGEILPGEDPLACAIREFKEETGFEAGGMYAELPPITQKGGKQVQCWALEQDIDATQISSNSFEIEWPPKSGKKKSFPEIDQAGWFGISEASRLINEKQRTLLVDLLALIEK